MQKAFFSSSLFESDREIQNAIDGEMHRQKDGIELIASENIASKAVLEAQGSVLTNKYAEGYPHKRYYGGCAAVDIAEDLAISRLCKLFGVNFANVQSHSGATANQTVFYAFLNPGDVIMGLDLKCGGHLTHGASMTQSGKWFKSVPYMTDENGLLDYQSIEKLARENKPKLIIAGTSAYSRIIDWAFFRKISDEVGAILMVDMAHLAGLIAGGAYPSPVPFADVITSTTHKTLRGPRGGIILWNDEKYTKQINSAVFPGMQGGPLMHVIAAKAVCFGEALRPDFKTYAEGTVANARALSDVLIAGGLKIITGGTDCHLMVVDLTPFGITGKLAEKVLEEAGLTCNKNTIPNDPQTPFITSGIRLGTPAGTTRGFGVDEFKKIGAMILRVLKNHENAEEISKVHAEVLDLCCRFPIY